MFSRFGFLPNRTATPTVTAAAAAAPAATVVGAAIVATAAAAQFTPAVKRNRDGNSRMPDCCPSVVSVYAVSIAMREICPRCLYVATVVGVEVSLPFELFIHMRMTASVAN